MRKICIVMLALTLASAMLCSCDFTVQTVETTAVPTTAAPVAFDLSALTPLLSEAQMLTLDAALRRVLIAKQVNLDRIILHFTDPAPGSIQIDCTTSGETMTDADMELLAGEIATQIVQALSAPPETTTNGFDSSGSTSLLSVTGTITDSVTTKITTTTASAATTKTTKPATTAATATVTTARPATTEETTTTTKPPPFKGADMQRGGKGLSISEPFDKNPHTVYSVMFGKRLLCFQPQQFSSAKGFALDVYLDHQNGGYERIKTLTNNRVSTYYTICILTPESRAETDGSNQLRVTNAYVFTLSVRTNPKYSVAFWDSVPYDPATVSYFAFNQTTMHFTPISF